MLRTLGVATIFCLLVTGTSFAGRGGRHGGHGGGGPVVRDHRSGPAPGPSRVVVRDHRRGGPVRVTNGRYVFPGGVVRVYKRPHYKRYYDRRVRPAIIVEQYDPVPGYVWVSGGWNWGGSEWIWTPGYWSVSAVVEAPPPPPPPTATVSGGISVNAGISIH